MAFDSLLYTECRVETSVHGREGMQFQAESSGVSPEMEQAVVAHMLYRPGADLMAARAPVADYPLSFAYRRVRDLHYLAVGRYLGTDSRGREGNQLTHCLVTADAEDIRPMRPAQLFGADAWSSAAHTSTELAPVSAPLLVAEDYQPQALHAMAREHDGVEEFLPRLLTAFEQAVAAEPRKLLVAADDVRVAARWLALGSLFLDPRDALGLSFRIFTDSPLADDLAVAVFDPATTRSVGAITSLPSSLNGVDLRTSATSAITPSDSARTYARWFLEHDVFDALDAIEIGRRWEPHLGSAATTITAVSLACLGDRSRPPADPPLLAEVLATLAEREPDDLEDYGRTLAEALLSVRPGESDDPAPLHRAAVVLRRHNHHDLAEMLTLALLEGARLDPDRYAVRWAHAVAATGSGRARWLDSESRSRAEQLLTETLAGARTGSLPALFTVVTAVNCGVGFPAVREAGQRLVEHWSAQPGAVADPRALAFFAELEPLLWQRLDARIAGRDEAARAAVLAGDWDWLRADGTRARAMPPALESALTARIVHSAPRGRRGALLADHLRRIAEPNWSLFFPATQRLDPELVLTWVAVRPRDLDDPGFERVVDEAVGEEIRDGGTALLDQLAGVDPLPVELARLVRDRGTMPGLLDTLEGHRDDARNPIIPTLRRIDRRVLELHRREIVDLLLLQEDVAGVGSFLDFWHTADLPEVFYRSTAYYLREYHATFAEQFVYLYYAEAVPAWVRTRMWAAFEEWAGADKKRAVEIERSLDPRFRPGWSALLQRFDSAVPGYQKHLNVFRRARKQERGGR
ncbi:hypothetical protein ACTD5D_31105 [Nocardia takedensis]|uniref:GAP1-N2 domain-containing protein n=1 Tax=Nocardia takedensis TaxID=259390 RepID=UPI00031E2EA8|nr:hypothetical protein [Nocardia takedensis]